MYQERKPLSENQLNNEENPGFDVDLWLVMKSSKEDRVKKLDALNQSLKRAKDIQDKKDNKR